MKREPYRPDAALEALGRASVRFVLIGGVAANALGSPSATFDIDICHARDRENLENLASCLQGLHARLRGAPAGVPFILDAKTLEKGDSFTFLTNVGSLDCLGTPAGTNGYKELLANSIELQLYGHAVRVAALDDIIRMKRAAGRPKDRIELEVLGALREEIQSIEARKRKRRRKKPPPRH